MVARKYKSADQLNQSTCQAPYRNELVPSSHAIYPTDHIITERAFSIQGMYPGFRIFAGPGKQNKRRRQAHIYKEIPWACTYRVAFHSTLRTVLLYGTAKISHTLSYEIGKFLDERIEIIASSLNLMQIQRKILRTLTPQGRDSRKIITEGGGGSENL